MMTSPSKIMTAEEFDTWVLLPENSDRHWEYIGGEIFDVPSNPYSSYLASRINRRLATFVEDNDLGFVTGEAGGYMVAGERYAPDVAFISNAKQESLPYTEGYNPNPPDLAIEIISPSDNERKLALKIANYLSVGTVVWIVRPDDKTVDIFAPNLPAKTLGENDILEVGAILKGFHLPVKDIFGTKKDSL